MAYEKTQWVNDQTPLSEANLNKIEEGIKNAHDLNAQQQGQIDTLDTTVNTEHAQRISTNETHIAEGDEREATLKGRVDIIQPQHEGMISGDVIVKKAERDANDNVIADTYATKSQHNTAINEIDKLKNGTTVAKKAEQDASGNVITSTYETKLDATSKKSEIDGQLHNLDLDVLKNKGDITNLQTNKVPKTTKVIGLDLQDDILLTEFKTALGNATQNVAGLLSAEDKTHLDGLVASLASIDGNSDGNTVVDTIGEILAIFQNYPEGADLVTVLNGKVDKEVGKGLSQNDFTDSDKNKVDLSYTHSEIVDGSNPHKTKFVNIADKPTTRDGYGIVDVYTKPETYTRLEINNLLDNLSAVKGIKSTLLTPTELSNGDTISTNLLTNNGAYVVFTATDTSTEEIDSDTVPVSTIITGKKFVFFDNQEIVFTIGETNSTFETSEDITLKINLLYLDNENIQAVDVEFDGSLTNYLEDQENVQSAINKLDEELKTTNDNSSNHITDMDNPHGVTKAQVELGNVDNTSDLDKPISTLTQNALNDKSNVGHTHVKADITDFSHTHLIEDITNLIEATQTISGLMSATDKARLDTLHALLEENEANTVVDSINEILAIFNNYPEGADLVSALANKVDKVSGKGLTKNELTDDLKGKYDTAYTHSTSAHAPSNAQVNVIETVKVNGVALPVSSKAVDITISDVDLTNYYNKTQTQSLINDAILGLLGGES